MNFKDVVLQNMHEFTADELDEIQTALNKTKEDNMKMMKSVRPHIIEYVKKFNLAKAFNIIVNKTTFNCDKAKTYLRHEVNEIYYKMNNEISNS
jgi:hypothetical protein